MGKYSIELIMNHGYEDAYQRLNRFTRDVESKGAWVLSTGIEREVADAGNVVGEFKTKELTGQETYHCMVTNISVADLIETLDLYLPYQKTHSRIKVKKHDKSANVLTVLVESYPKPDLPLDSQ